MTAAEERELRHEMARRAEEMLASRPHSADDVIALRDALWDAFQDGRMQARAEIRNRMGDEAFVRTGAA